MNIPCRLPIQTAAATLTLAWLLFTAATPTHCRAQQAQTTPATEHFSHTNFTPPAGWTRSMAGGWLQFTPPGLAPGKIVALQVSPGGPSSRDLTEEFGAFVKASAGGMTIVKQNPSRASTDPQGLKTISQTVIQQDASGNQLLRYYVARRNGDRFEALAFTANDAELVVKYKTVLTDFLTSMRFDGAPAPQGAAPAALPNQAAKPDRQLPNTPLPAETAPAQTGAAPLAPDKSAIVHPNKSGDLAVAAANGSPIDGIKISKHDTNIQSPSIVVAPNGVIHVAFLGQQARGTECAIYHRSSADGGNTWSEAKNLSEVMPELSVGSCQVAADSAGRVYVIWRVASVKYGQAAIDPHSRTGCTNNLVYRVLSGGQWSGKAIPIHQMASSANQLLGSASYFVTTDPAGTVHVLWTEDPGPLHPDVKFSPTQNSADVGISLVMEAMLNGATPTAPREVYLPPVTKNALGPVCDDLDLLNGYVDAANKAHFVALVAPARGTPQSNQFQVIENGGQTPGVALPGAASEYWGSPPTLLVDAQGHQHILTLYSRGEQPNFRDYTVGSEAEPKTIRAVKGNAGKLLSLAAFQGPGGRMVAIMNMNDTGGKTDQELYVSTSNGGPWSPPVNVTNNSGRLAFHSTNTSARSNVATMSWGFPGAASGTFDRSGHLLLLYVRNKLEVFGSNAVGVQLAGSSSATPNLMFLRF